MQRISLIRTAPGNTKPAASNNPSNQLSAELLKMFTPELYHGRKREGFLFALQSLDLKQPEDLLEITPAQIAQIPGIGYKTF